MDVNLITTEISRRSLKCAMCNNYLSYFPICILENSQNICGRCFPPPDYTYLLNTAYERACRWIKFPCIYEGDGCTMKLLPEDVPQHEETCSYRMPCPLISTHCGWKGHVSRLLQHCRSRHSTKFLDNLEFDLIVNRSHESENFVELGSQTVLLLRRKYDSDHKLLTFSACHSGKKESKYFCEITFTSGGRSYETECEVFSFKDNNREDVVFELTHRHRVGSAQEVINVESVTNSVTSALNEEMLSLLKCSDCADFALPPVYQFSENIIRCFKCREKMLTTGTSNQGMRCFSVDNIANKLDYPCKYRKYGCTFIAKPDVMIYHLNSCLCVEYDCPFSDICEWKGIQNDLLSHIRTKHQHLLITPAGKSIPIFFCVTSKNLFCCGVIYIFNRLFKYRFGTENNLYLWTIEPLGQPHDIFKYELKLNDKKGASLTMRQLCIPASRQSRKQNCCFYWYFPCDQVKFFVNNDILRVTLSIDL